MGGGSLNPLSMILKENRLTGPNYIDWKRNLNLVLTAEEYKYVLIDVCPPRLAVSLATAKRLPSAKERAFAT